jgi:phage terminase large subunit-like protein
MTSQSTIIKARRRWGYHVDKIRRFTSVEVGESKAVQLARIERARRDYAFFVEYYFPHFCTDERTGKIIASAKFHIEAANKILRNRDLRRVFEWARAHAKSTHMDLFVPMWLKCQKERQINVMVLVGKSQDNANTLLGDLQAELQYNERYTHDFGQQYKSGSWSEGAFVTVDETAFFARGRGQSPRGLRVFAQRPDYIVADDLEDKDTAKNPIRQLETVSWIEGDLIPAMDGNVRRYLHPNNNPFPSSIQGMLEQRHPEWKLHRVDACPGAKRLPRWSSKYSRDYYLQLEEELTTLVLEAEYNNNPHVIGKIFVDSLIIWDKVPHINHFQHLLAYWDVAYSDAVTADYNAVKVWGLKGDKFYLIKAYVRQSTMGDAIRWMFELQKMLPVRINFYYESQFWNDALLMTYREIRRLYNCDISLIKDDVKKENKYDRMLTMLPYYQQERVIYNIAEKASNDMQVGLAQLKGIEPGYKTHDDSPDADERAIHLLSRHISARALTTDAIFGGHRRTNKF